MSRIVFTLAWLLGALLWAVTAVAAPVSEPQAGGAPPEQELAAAVLLDLGTRSELYALAPDAPVVPASLTKIMSLYVLLDAVARGEFSLLDQVRVSAKADRMPGSSMGALTNRAYPLWEVLKGMAVGSGNDAAQAAAEHFPGGIEAFVARMNETARALGMTHSHFENPHGLHAEGQETTARDLALLAAAYLERFPQALALHTMPFAWHGETRTRNRNSLLERVPGVDGLKTGFVQASGYNIVVTAERDGIRLVGVVLGAPTAKKRDKQAERLLEWGFSGGAGREP